MGVLSWLFGKRVTKHPAIVARISNGPGTFSFNIVGESHYQKNIERICGPKGPESKRHITNATLLLQKDNPYDKNAVAIVIDKLVVGYLSRDDAKAFRSQLAKLAPPGQVIEVAECAAMIVGGWDRGDGNEGSFGVKLDLPLSNG